MDTITIATAREVIANFIASGDADTAMLALDCGQPHQYDGEMYTIWQDELDAEDGKYHIVDGINGYDADTDTVITVDVSEITTEGRRELLNNAVETIKGRFAPRGYDWESHRDSYIDDITFNNCDAVARECLADWEAKK